MPKQKQKMKKKKIEATVVGMQFHSSREFRQMLARKEYGIPCLLLPEPTNPTDPNAIQVYARNYEIMVGYIARGTAEVITKALVDGWLIADGVWMSNLNPDLTEAELVVTLKKELG